MYDPNLAQALRQFAERFQGQLNHMAGALRQREGQVAALEQQVRDLHGALASLRVTKSDDRDPRVLRIEDMPGKRYPQTLLVEIPVGANVVGKQQQSLVIGQEGPFVAVKRFATFLSAYEFQAADPVSGATTRFTGRSYGRFRPVHSAHDIMDGAHNAYGDAGFWYMTQLLNFATPAGTILPSGALGLPSNMSSFRTMEFDGRVSVYVQGSGAPRQNIGVPSSLWVEGAGESFVLGALDFFERGDTMVFEVVPTHVNNPPAGNVNGSRVLPAVGGLGVAAGWPYIEGQFDAHEGIATPSASDVNVADALRLPDLLATDNVTRLPNGILILGYEGFRIGQPISPV